jgi:hypothetical protein
MTERDFWLQQRAALLSQVKGIEQQRAALLQQVAAIERMYSIEKKPQQTVAIQPQDSVAGIMMLESENA